VTPTSSWRPIAPIAADIANSPVWSQNASKYSGTHSSTTTRAIASNRTRRSRRRSDTADLPAAEDAGWAPEEHEQQRDVRHDLRETTSEERDLVLVTRGHRRRHTDREASDHRAARRVQTAEHGCRDRGQREQAGRVVDAGGREAREERAADRRQRAGDGPGAVGDTAQRN